VRGTVIDMETMVITPQADDADLEEMTANDLFDSANDLLRQDNYAEALLPLPDSAAPRRGPHPGRLLQQRAVRRGAGRLAGRQQCL
jgi:hypothetical protein